MKESKEKCFKSPQEILTLEVLVCLALLTDLGAYLHGQIDASVREEPESKAALGPQTPNPVAPLLSGS